MNQEELLEKCKTYIIVISRKLGNYKYLPDDIAQDLCLFILEHEELCSIPIEHVCIKLKQYALNKLSAYNREAKKYVNVDLENIETEDIIEDEDVNYPAKEHRIIHYIKRGYKHKHISLFLGIPLRTYYRKLHSIRHRHKNLAQIAG